MKVAITGQGVAIVAEAVVSTLDPIIKRSHPPPTAMDTMAWRPTVSSHIDPP